MSNIIQIVIADKRPSVVGSPVIVCGNSNYSIEFTFDAEWADQAQKVARFVYYKDGLSLYQDAAFTGNTVNVPTLYGVAYVLVGVYAGNLRTTTPAKVLCDRSILCGDPLEVLTPEEKAKLQAQIGDLSQLGTTAKSSLVAAINEATQSGGLTAAQIAALDGMFKIVAYTEDPAAAYAAFKAAFTQTDAGGNDTGGGDSGGSGDNSGGETEATLSSISATYSGGDVAEGTAVSDLTGIVVTAHYSDGSTETVTEYTLSGTIAEGSNTITVSYGGKTTTITVTGVAMVEPLYGRFWPPKGKVLDWNVPQWDDVDNFAYTSNVNGTQSEYEKAGLPGGSFIRLDKLQGAVYIRVLTNNQYGIMEQGCYQVYANSDGEIATGGFAKITHAVYRQFGGKTQSMDVDGTTYYFMMFKFEIPAGQTGYFLSTANAMANGYFISTDKTGIDDAYKPYYTLFGSDPSDRITEPATEVA